MNKIFTFLVFLVMSTNLMAQAPEGIVYQAEARDNTGNVLQNTLLDVKIQILEDNPSGVIVWEGLHNVTTNKFGMFVLVIGTGTKTYGNDFGDIKWGEQEHFLNVQVKSENTATWIDMGTTQFLSVPYALYAKTAGSVLPESGHELKSGKTGVPAQTWSLFGNSKTDAEKDKFGTTDDQDLVFVTDNVERLRITSDGQLLTADGVGLELGGNLSVHGDETSIDKDLYVGRNVFLNTDDTFSPAGETFNYGNFTVEGTSSLNNSLFVTGSTDLDGSLHTSGDVNFDSGLSVGGITQLNSSLHVEGATSLANTLHTSGDANFDSGLSVGGITQLNSSLYVDGKTTLANDLIVEGDGHFDSQLNVDGYFSVNNNLFTVDNSNGNTDVAGDLDVAGTGEFKNLRVTGSGGQKGEHVALFENSDGGTADGIAIKINKEKTTDENNFITFYRQDFVAGRIEGYHLGDNDLAFIEGLIKPMVGSSAGFFTNTLGFTSPIDLNLNFITFSNGSLPSLSGGSFSEFRFPSLNAGSLPSLSFKSPISFNAGVTEIIQPWTWFKPNLESLSSPTRENPMFLLFAEAYENDWKTLTDMGITELFIKAAEMQLEANIKSEGVTYGSKGADYAEWLPRMNEEDQLAIGQVVGVHGGKISLTTENADQILVISSKPIVLGNLPDKNNEELYEKVAFMGQVPTWVKGHVNIGDYIVASQKNDGSGVAVSPDKITAEDIPNIVGKAWSESDNLVLSLINVAIGLNRNDIVKIVSAQQNQLNNLESRLVNLEQMLNANTGGLTENK